MAEPNELNFLTTEDFALPETFDREALPLLNQVLDSADYYNRAPLLDRRGRGRVFGGRQTLAGFAVKGFALHTLVPIDEKRVGTEAYVAPPAGVSETDFLMSCIQANRIALPEPDFEQKGIDELAAILAETDKPVATGIVFSVDTVYPDTSLYNLLVPRTYVERFGIEGASIQQNQTTAIKIASKLFLDLTAIYIKGQEPASEDDRS